MIPVWLGAMNMPMPTEFKKISAAKPRYGKSTGNMIKRNEGRRHEHEAAGGEGAGAVAVGQHAADRPGQQQARP